MPTTMSHSGIKLELRIEEVEAELDALTGGAFTRLARPAAAERRRPMTKLYPVAGNTRVSTSTSRSRCRSQTPSSTRARATCRAPGVCLVAEQPIPRETEISLELVLTFGDAGTSEPLKVIGRVAWCTALFGSFQIGVKFVKVDDDRARYLDMFVGFLDGTLAPGGMGSDEEEHGGARTQTIPSPY